MNDSQIDDIQERDEPSPTSAQDVTADIADDGEPKPSRFRGSKVMFALIAAGLAGTYFMYVKTGPQRAAAAPAAAAAHTTVNSFLSTGQGNMKLMEKMLRNTEKVVGQFLKYPAVTQVALADLKTNPFRQGAATIKNDAALDEVAAVKRKEQQRQTALQAVQGLQLQSVLVSDRNRSCMINNALYLEGQQVESFTIERIAAGSVVVRSGAYRFELQMTR